MKALLRGRLGGGDVFIGFRQHRGRKRIRRTGRRFRRVVQAAEVNFVVQRHGRLAHVKGIGPGDHAGRVDGVVGLLRRFQLSGANGVLRGGNDLFGAALGRRQQRLCAAQRVGAHAGRFRIDFFRIQSGLIIDGDGFFDDLFGISLRLLFGVFDKEEGIGLADLRQFLRFLTGGKQQRVGLFLRLCHHRVGGGFGVVQHGGGFLLRVADQPGELLFALGALAFGVLLHRLLQDGGVALRLHQQHGRAGIQFIIQRIGIFSGAVHETGGVILRAGGQLLRLGHGGGNGLVRLLAGVLQQALRFLFGGLFQLAGLFQRRVGQHPCLRLGVGHVLFRPFLRFRVHGIDGSAGFLQQRIGLGLGFRQRFFRLRLRGGKGLARLIIGGGEDLLRLGLGIGGQRFGLFLRGLCECRHLLVGRAGQFFRLLRGGTGEFFRLRLRLVEHGGGFQLCAVVELVGLGVGLVHDLLRLFVSVFNGFRRDLLGIIFKLLCLGLALLFQLGGAGDALILDLIRLHARLGHGLFGGLLRPADDIRGVVLRLFQHRLRFFVAVAHQRVDAALHL